MIAEQTELASRRDLWIMRQSVDGNEHVTDVVCEDQLKIVNERELKYASMELRYTRSLKIAGDPVIPPGFMHPSLFLPLDNFALDYFEVSSATFISRRFRDAIDQPSDVLQYWLVDIVRGSGEAYAKDYMMLRILAHQSALDWDRSVYDSEEIVNRRTGEHLTSISVEQFVPLGSLVPSTEIFRASESRLTVLVVDALAERVLRGKCDGVCFREPQTIGLVNRAPRRLRMDYGVLVDDADLADWAVAHGINTFR